MKFVKFIYYAVTIPLGLYAMYYLWSAHNDPAVFWLKPGTYRVCTDRGFTCLETKIEEYGPQKIQLTTEKGDRVTPDFIERVKP